MANKTYSVVTGSINGRLSEFFQRLSTLHAKQSFSIAIIAGNLFGDPEQASDAENDELSKLINGEIEVPLPTYFTLGTRSLPPSVVERLESSDGELCPNLSILGRKVSIKTSDGFKIVAVGGAYAPNADEPMNSYEAIYRDTDVQALTKDLGEIDLLITSDWPAAIRDGSSQYYIAKPPRGVQSIADLCTALKPRYHFSASEASYVREPFFHAGETPHSITRFLSLAPFGNTDKQKWVFAFSLEPSASPPNSLPEDTTASPFVQTKKRKLDSQQDSYNSFRYANGNGASNYQQDRGPRRKKRAPPPTPDNCFFCLSNEACETHMIGSIGTDCYIAVAKGPLTERTTFPNLGFPGHMLIIPVQHVPTISAIPDKEAQQSTLTELQRYRSAMHDMLSAKSKDASGRCTLGAVTWRISRPGGVHLQDQFLPVPVDLVQRGLVEAAFDAEAENLSYPQFAKTASAMSEAEEGDFMKVMIWCESLRKDMVLPIDDSYRFDLQFGRKVMAKLLGLEKRMNWKTCAQAKEEEEADANAFKEAFKEYDFSLEED